MSLAPMRGKAQESPACESLVPPKSPAADSFASALADVGSIEDCEHWDGLEAIDRSNPNLIWDSTGTRVLMVTWLENKPNSKTKTNARWWATTVPTIRSMLQREVYKKAAGNVPKLNVFDRTRKYLGLRPESRPQYFVEFWASQKDLKRPCEDPEPTDHRCMSLKRLDTFMNKDPKKPYPFTGLGYSYDWGNEVTEVGASEFVVEEKTEIQVFQIIETSQYLSCGQKESFTDPNVSVLRTCESQ